MKLTFHIHKSVDFDYIQTVQRSLCGHLEEAHKKARNMNLVANHIISGLQHWRYSDARSIFESSSPTRGPRP